MYSHSTTNGWGDKPTNNRFDSWGREDSDGDDDDDEIGEEKREW